jgi:hypothetical protein
MQGRFRQHSADRLVQALREEAGVSGFNPAGDRRGPLERYPGV